MLQVIINTREVEEFQKKYSQGAGANAKVVAIVVDASIQVPPEKLPPPEAIKAGQRYFCKLCKTIEFKNRVSIGVHLTAYHGLPQVNVSDGYVTRDFTPVMCCLQKRRTFSLPNMRTSVYLEILLQCSSKRLRLQLKQHWCHRRGGQRKYSIVFMARLDPFSHSGSQAHWTTGSSRALLSRSTASTRNFGREKWTFASSSRTETSSSGSAISG